MTQFHLKIVTPDGERFNGMAEGISLRTVSGEMGILAHHIDCARARMAEESAREVLAQKDASATQLELAQAKLKRALIRQSVYDRK